MRFVCLALATTVLAVAGAAQAGVRLPQASCVGWRGVGAIEARGTSAIGGLTGAFAMTAASDGRYAARRDYQVYSEGEGFDGELAWTSDRSGGSHFLDAKPAREIAASEAWVRRRAWCGSSVAAERLPGEIDAGAALSVWRVTPTGGVPVTLRFDTASGLLRQSELRTWSTRLIRHFDDWRDAGQGVLVPFVERDDYPEDEETETLTLASAAIAPHAPTVAFARPPRPHDYEIVGGGSTTVPYEDDGVGRIFVPVTVDGHGPFPFELDTGGHLILTTDTAALLGARAVGDFSATGGGIGIARSGVVGGRELRIGQAVIRNQPAKVLALSGDDRGARPPRAGLLGLELFERFAISLDRRAKTITLTRLEDFHANPRGVALPISFIEDAPLTQGAYAGAAGLFEIDSGDAGPAIIEGWWAREHGFTARLDAGLDWTGGGVGGAYGEKLSRGDLRLGPIALPHEVVSYAGLPERGSESTRLQAGVIGESSLYRFDMTYDYGHGRVWIDPKTDIPPRPFNRAGVRFSKDKSGRFMVTGAVPGSPAQAAGIRADEQILAIDGKDVAGMSRSDAAVLMAGPVGAELKLSLRSPGGAVREVRLRLKELLP